MSNIEFTHTSILSGIQQLGDFSRIFFSKQNVEWVQLHLRYAVYKASGNVISNQSEQELLLIMRAVYLQESINPANASGYKKELLRLNNRVIHGIVPKLVKEVEMYQKYLKDALRNPVPMIDRPIHVSSAGTKGNAGFSDVLGVDTISVRPEYKTEMVGFKHFV